MPKMIGFKALKLSVRLTLIFAGYAGLLLALVVGSLSWIERSALQTAVQSELRAEALEQETAVGNWVREREQDLAALADSPDLQRHLSDLLTAAPGLPDRPTIQSELRDDLLPWVTRNQGFLSLFILDPLDGQVLAASDPTEAGRLPADRSIFSLGQLGPYTQNPYFSSDLRTTSMHSALPVRAADGRLLGVLAGRLDLREWSVILARTAERYQTDDSYLVDAERWLIIPPLRSGGAAEPARAADTPELARCLAGESGLGPATDYRGQPVYLVYRWLPEWQLCLLVQRDQNAALAPIIGFTRLALGLGLATLALGVALAGALGRSISRPLTALQERVARLSRGQFDPPGALTGPEELAALAREFDRLTAALAAKEAQLQAHAGQLERTVAERTAALRASQRFSQQVADSMPGLVYIFDFQTRRPVYLNAGAQAALGFPPEPALGLDFLAARWHPEDEQRYWTEIWPRCQAAADQQPVENEYRLRDAAGEWRWFFSREVVYERGPDGAPRQMLGVAQDVTERKRGAEQLARQADELRRSNAELERFAYVASHDLQEPLRMVSSYLRLLERRYAPQLDSDAREFIDFAVDGATRMKRLIDDLLTYSRVNTRARPFTRVALETVWDQTLENLSLAIAESGAQLTHTPLPEVLGDASQLTQLFQNLLGNALKFRSGLAPQVRLGARLADDGAAWVLAVADNGIGIAPEYFERVFQIFQRLHGRDEYPGTGIGLAIAQKIVERHGGRIWVESQPGCGATFSFTLPVQPPGREVL